MGSERIRSAWIAMRLVGLVVVGLFASGIGASAAAQAPRPFFEGGQYDERIPTPASILGRPIGQRPVRHTEVVRYFEALAGASPHAKLTMTGESHEGRALVVLEIGENADERSASVRKANRTLARPAPDRKDGDLGDHPVVAWLGYCIHGDEISGTDAALQLAYQLVAGTDARTKRIRNSVYVLIDPLQNPDGRERFLGMIQQTNGKVLNPDVQSLHHAGYWPRGRGNHYLFDLNRDYVAAVHPETRARLTVFRSWEPQVVVDGHEMGPGDSYLFSPPREPFNPHFTPGTLDWGEVFARDQAKAFDRYGWRYYTREWLENFYPGYTDAIASLAGAVGILYEQSRVDGTVINRADGTTITYRESVHHQFVSSIANLETAARERTRLLQAFREVRRVAARGEKPGGIGGIRPSPEDAAAAYVVPWTALHASRIATLLRWLRQHGITVKRATAGFRLDKAHAALDGRAETIDVPSNSLIIPLAQPRSQLARALVAFDPRMSDAFVRDERKSIEAGRGSRLYDTTAWGLPFLLGVDCYWATSLPEIAFPDATPLAKPTPGVTGGGAGQFGYLLEAGGESLFRTIDALLHADLVARVATRPFQLRPVATGRAPGDPEPVRRDPLDAATAYERGTVWVPRAGNPEDLRQRLAAIGAKTGARFRPIDTGYSAKGPDLGGRFFPTLAKPRIAIVTGSPASPQEYGAIWHLFDHALSMRVSTIPGDALTGRLDKYNVLILPPVRGDVSRLLGDRAMKRLAAWVANGGTLIAVGNATDAFTKLESQGQGKGKGKPSGLSGVRRRRDVLAKLDVYERDLERQRRADDPTVDFDALWARGAPKPAASAEKASIPAAAKPGEAAGQKKDGDPKRASAAEKPAKKRTDDERKERDAWLRRFRPSGAFLRATVDCEHWLTMGLTAIDPSAKPTALAGRPERLVERAADLAVLYDSSTALLAKAPVEVPVRFTDAERIRVSGLVWPEARERMAHAAYLTRERRGAGQVILFATHPNFRGMTIATRRLLLNAAIFGPALGTRRQARW